VGVQSEFGKGSTFWFTALLSAGSSEPYILMPSIDLRGKRVLVVDDNRAAALVLCETLGELGFSVQAVDSGQTALQCIVQAASEQQPFTFFLVDWLMPGMDGLDTVRQLKAMQLPLAPAVILVTAHRREELLQSAEQLGVQHVLSKPVNGSMLVNTMMQLMGFATRANVPVRALQASTMESELGAIQGARILLVEDNEINQQVATEVLTGAGFDVDVAENGQVAVHSVEARFASARPYDLVLMDMQMPVMDGVTATRLIRETHPSEILPIVAMTANAMTTDKERCLEAGMNGFVRKPIEPDELWRELLRWIRVRPGLGNAPPRQNTTQPTARLDAFAHIDGLDSACGLLRTGGNPDFYLSMVRKFMQSQAHAVADAEAALARGDTTLAERLAHTLHGIAGNLGATTLQMQASALEQALRQGKSQNVDLLFAKTQVTLAALIDKLTQAIATLPTDISPDAQANFDPLQLKQVLSQLSVMLQGDDPNGATFWTQHAVALRGHLKQAHALEDAIQGFDFERAIQLLNEEALH
jgi:CheY-like chemotaxis protein